MDVRVAVVEGVGINLKNVTPLIFDVFDIPSTAMTATGAASSSLLRLGVWPSRGPSLRYFPLVVPFSSISSLAQLSLSM